MPQHFNRLGISFQYPDGWTLDDADAVAGRDSVTVYAPGGSFWSVAVHPASDDPLELAETIIDAMKQEYASVEVEEAHDPLLGIEAVGFDMSFYYVDFINSAQVRSLRARGHTYSVLCQGEDREFATLTEVFRAMTASLLLDPGKDEDK